ncbi:MAG: carbonic anhydrase [Chitinophagaceae bacterium]
MIPVLPLLLVVTGFLFTTSCTTNRTPAAESTGDPLEQLIKGNKRFATGHSVHPHESFKRRHEIASGQHPVAAILCCSDSRVSPEIILDQGLGDLFVIRTAGNLMGGLEIGSIEYAVEHLGVKQVLIIGHKECGALKAFVDGNVPPGHIRDIVDSIKKEKEILAIPASDKNLLYDCIRANIVHGVRQLKSESAIVSEKIRTGGLKVTGGYYDLEKGEINLVTN